MLHELPSKCIEIWIRRCTSQIFKKVKPDGNSIIKCLNHHSSVISSVTCFRPWNSLKCKISKSENKHQTSLVLKRNILNHFKLLQNKFDFYFFLFFSHFFKLFYKLWSVSHHVSSLAQKLIRNYIISKSSQIERISVNSTCDDAKLLK